MAQTVVFMILVTLTLTLDLYYILLSDALGRMYWNLHAKFNNNPSSINW